MWLKALRTETGCSHDQIGARVGRTRQQLITYEKGSVEPKAATFLDLLGVLGVNVKAFGVTRPPTLSEIDEKLDLIAGRKPKQTDDLAALAEAVTTLAEELTAWRTEARDRLDRIENLLAAKRQPRKLA